MIQPETTKRVYPTLPKIVEDFGQIDPSLFADGVDVELAWKYGVKPSYIRQLYIAYLDGVS